MSPYRFAAPFGAMSVVSCQFSVEHLGSKDVTWVKYSVMVSLSTLLYRRLACEGPLSSAAYEELAGRHMALLTLCYSEYFRIGKLLTARLSGLCRDTTKVKRSKWSVWWSVTLMAGTLWESM